MKRKQWEMGIWEKASYTIELALLCPLLFLCSYGVVKETLQLYATVKEYAEECIMISKEKSESPQRVRLLAFVADEL